MDNESLTVGTSDRAIRSRSAHLYFWTIALASAAVDLGSKWWAHHVLDPKQPMEIIPGLLHFTAVLNEGAVFGSLAGKRWLFVIASIVAMGFILQLFLQSRARQRVFQLLLALTFGGAIGNLYDRLVFGKVRDFIYFSIIVGGKELWPFVFNIADVVLVVGVCGLLLGWLLGKFDMPYCCPVARPITLPDTKEHEH